MVCLINLSLGVDIGMGINKKQTFAIFIQSPFHSLSPQTVGREWNSQGHGVFSEVILDLWIAAAEPMSGGNYKEGKTHVLRNFTFV